MADPFVTVDITTDPEQLYDESVAELRALLPGWEPNANDPVSILLRVNAQLAAENRAVAAEVPALAAAAVAESIFGIVRQDATAATSTVTVTAVDDAGYTLPAATVVIVAATGSEKVAFATVEQAVIAPGDTTVAGVLIAAVIPGANANDLTGAAEPNDALDWISSIVLDEATSGGTDADTGQEHLDKWAAEMTLLLRAPVLPDDFARLVVARIAGVHRAVAFDGWDPTTWIEEAGQDFEVDTAGWAVTALAGFHEAGTSITRVSTAPFAGTWHGRIITPGAVAFEGAHWDITDTFTAGETYRARIKIRVASGSKGIGVAFGVAGDRVVVGVGNAATEIYQEYVAYWSPRVTQAAAVVAVFVGDDSAEDIYVDEGVVESQTLGETAVIAVLAIDEDGDQVGAGVKAEADTLLQSLVLQNYVVHIADVIFTVFDVDVAATKLAGYDGATVDAAVVAAIGEYLDGRNWGTGVPGPSWGESTHVRYLELAEVVNRVDGVHYITALTVNGVAGVDWPLAGPGGLPRAGAVTATIT